jgi:ABC-type transport system involved in multi-copper enzyme maturation permease subunit
MNYILERKNITDNGFAGLFNLLNVELQNWFQTRKIWVHIVMWALLIFGLTIIAGVKNFAVKSSLDSFLNFTGVFASVGVIVTAQSVIIGERRSGVTSWLLSKPTSRTSYIISKILGNLSGYFIAMSLIPSVLIFTYLSIRSDLLFSIGRLSGLIGFVVIYFSFYLSMTIMLGSFFRNRGVVAGLPIGIFFGQGLLSSVLPKQALYFPNSMLSADGSVNSVVGNYFLNGTISSYESLITTIVLAVCFLMIAIWRFNREEL